MASTPPYLVRVHLKEDAVESDEYPFSLPIVRVLDIEFASPVTFFVGENGTGKSTLIEAIAALCRLPVSGGGRNEQWACRPGGVDVQHYQLRAKANVSQPQPAERIDASAR